MVGCDSYSSHSNSILGLVKNSRLKIIILGLVKASLIKQIPATGAANQRPAAVAANQRPAAVAASHVPTAFQVTSGYSLHCCVVIGTRCCCNRGEM